jgi:threonine efflux protein
VTAYASSYLLIASLYLLAAASPGPNFFIISQLALNGDRATALRVTTGIVIGSAVWVSAAAAGLATLMLHYGSIATVLRVAGAAYLMWYGFRLLRRAARPDQMPALPSAPAPAQARAGSPAGLRTGLLTSFTNPKAAAFWTSVFASTLPVGAPLGFYLGVVLLITLLSAFWHMGIALVFSRPALRAGYARARRPIEALSGASLIAMGLRQALAR